MARATASITLPDRYRVVRHIANGGMASVWAAHDEVLDRAVAVKVLAAHLSEDDSARRRFQREARTAAGLSSHPHVATIYDVGEHEGKSYIVMELLPGGTVADRLKSGREIDDDTALRWLREAGSALDAAHEAGIVHRDVKPANMLLDGRGPARARRLRHRAARRWRTRSPRPARSSAPPPTSRPSRRWASPPRRPRTATRSPSSPSSC